MILGIVVKDTLNARTGLLVAGSFVDPKLQNTFKHETSTLSEAERITVAGGSEASGRRR